MPESKNCHIYDFLDYYISLTNPEYAVLIDGCWGSGKTWLIRDFFSGRDPESQNHIYVSLYGMKATDEIDRAFFVQLHPKLASKGVTVAGKLVGGVLKMGSDLILKTKPDTDGVGDILQSWLTDTEGRVLVFDDLERCEMPIKETLGYINSFVEHGGYRCILLANENEILPRPSDTHSYREIKEKLIGQSVTVRADLRAAFSAFTAEVGSESARAALSKHTDTICEIYRLSRDDNLRILRHAIYDVARVLEKLRPEYASNDDLLKILLAQQLVYSIEIRSTRLQASEIGNVKTAHMLKLMEKLDSPDGEDTDSETPTLPEKYPIADLERPIVQEGFWESFYQHGVIDEEQLNLSISECYFFYNNNTPSWKRILDLWSLSNEEYRDILGDIRERLSAKEYHDIGIIKHAYGMLLFLSNAEVIDDTPADILTSAKEYVDYLAREGILVDNLDDFGRINDEDHYAHTQYWGTGEPKFAELRRYIVQKTAESIAASLPEAGTILLSEMQEDTALFARRLNLTNSTDNIYYNKPILAHILPEAFMEALFNLHRSNWRIVTSALRERYRHQDFARQLLEEQNWLEVTCTLLATRLEELQGTLDQYRINELIKYLGECIERLEAVKPHDSAE